MRAYRCLGLSNGTLRFFQTVMIISRTITAGDLLQSLTSRRLEKNLIDGQTASQTQENQLDSINRYFPGRLSSTFLMTAQDSFRCCAERPSYQRHDVDHPHNHEQDDHRFLPPTPQIFVVGSSQPVRQKEDHVED